MKRITLLLLLLLFSNTGLNAQLIKNHLWKPVLLPVDSVLSIDLLPIDSLRVVCGVVKDSVYIDSFGNGARMEAKYYLETSDGGKTWVSRSDSINGFYGGRKTPYSSKIIPVGNNRRFLLSSDGPNVSIYKSDDTGKSWKQQWKDKGAYNLATTLTKNDVLLYSGDSAQLYRSTDAGLTFPYKISDDVFTKTIMPQTAYDSTGGHIKAEFRSYVRKDILFHTLFIGTPISLNGTATDTVFKSFPKGIHTLLTTSGGASWKHYITPLPLQRYDESIYGEFQYPSDKSRLFFFMNDYGSEYSIYRDLGKQDRYGPLGCGTNYLYSDDDGKSWKIEADHYRRRRAYEAVGQNELWFTLTKNDMVFKDTVRAAYIIARTTDNGETWEYDSTTLGQLFEQKADGRVIAFSDPRHGWIAAHSGSSTFILRYDANEQPLSVESDKGHLTYYPMWLHPMPAKDEVEVHSMDKGTIESIELYDIMGRKIDCTYTSNDNEGKVTLRNVPSGHYVVHAKLSGKYYSRPLIVRK